MRAVKIHVFLDTKVDGIDRQVRRTFLICEYLGGQVDIVEEGHPRGEADRSVAVGGSIVIEVEAV